MAFFSWPGSKRRSIDFLNKQLPNKIDGNYYEPFIGGGSSLLNVLERLDVGTIKIKGKIITGDYDPLIVDTFTMTKNNPRKLLTEINKWFSRLMGISQSKMRSQVRSTTLSGAYSSRETFYFYCLHKLTQLKRKRNKSQSEKITQSALLIFILKFSFGSYIKSKADGTLFASFIPSKAASRQGYINGEKLMRASYLLKKYNVSIENKSYERLLSRTKSTDFTYLDPPYYSSDKGIYTTSEFDTNQFASFVGSTLKGFWLVSNSLQFSKKYLKGYTRITKKVVYASPSGHKSISEMYIKNY